MEIARPRNPRCRCFRKSSVIVIPTEAGTPTGRVVGITDGETLTVLVARRVVKVRLTEIFDAPESGQPWGSRSKESLSDLCFGKSATLETQGQDRYKRTIT